MKIQRIIKFLLIIAVLAISMPKAMAQRGSNQPDPHEVLFWFNIKINKTIDRESRLEEYMVRLISPTISHGSAKAFQKALWTGTVQGSKFAVGPFQSLSEAQNAMKIYKTVKDTTLARDTKKYGYWFLVKVDILERSKSYQLERMAAHVANGNHKEFTDVLRESLSFKTIAIGPFESDIQAERAKHIYRIEE